MNSSAVPGNSIATNRRKGAHICPNSLIVGMRDADDAVLTVIEDTLLHPAVVTRALKYAERAIMLDRSADQRASLEADLADVEAAVRRLTAAAVVPVVEVQALLAPADGRGADAQERRRAAQAALIAALR